MTETGASVHPSAAVDPGAQLGEGVQVGPYAVIGPHVRIGKDTVVNSHTVVEGHTTVGERNFIGPFASLGQPPQDTKFKGEKTELKIGDGNVIREQVTIHVGTATGRGITTIGNDCFFLVGVHIAHDCIIGDRAIIANATHLGGHVEIEDDAVMGALIGVHQFVRIGRVAMVSAKAGLPMDVPPYTIAAGDRASLRGLNKTGMERVDIPKERRAELRKAYRIIFKSSLKLKDALEKAREEVPPSEELEHLISFINKSSRGITR